MSSGNIYKLTVGKWRENCYIIEKDGIGIIIDPGDESQLIIDHVVDSSIKPLAIINTHAHYDHVGAITQLKDEFKIPFYLHSGDKKLLHHASIYRSFVGENIKYKIPEIDFFLDGLDTICLETINLSIFYTPGHTEGSVCIKYEDNLFTGDYLLNSKLGRTDLPGANKEKFKRSVNFITNFPPDTKIYPGHGKIITLKNEMKNNPELKKILNEVQN